MLTAMKQAAQLANSDYVYLVFAKTQIHNDFMFDYSPDYCSNPKNYIFYAYNPVLDYSYGHGSIVLYDKHWLLDVQEKDLRVDVTLSHEVEVVPEISCVNYFDSDWSAYRTAFREAYKLAQSQDITDKKRLKLWCESDRTQFGPASKKGACAGRKYALEGGLFSNVNNWNWLKQQFESDQ